jgi:ADP-heptose:LPS heptosyltransferase
LVKALSEQYSSINITVVSRPFFKPLFDSIPNVTFLAIYVKKRHKGVLGLIRLFFDLRKLNIDAFADLHNVLRSKVMRTLFALSRKKVAFVDKGRPEKKALTRVENKIFQPLTTMFERHQLVLESLGFPIDLSRPQFPEKAEISQTELATIVSQSNTIIGIAPFAQYDSKVYPLDLMQKVIDALASHKNSTIFLFGGGQKEKEQLQSLVGNKTNVLNMAGKIPFQEELNLISNLDVMLSMDSGNGHIAAMLGIPVMTLWGATHPFAGFLPFNQSLDNALVSDRNQYPNLPTSVYGNKKVAGYENAMRTILPEQVVARMEDVLRSKK